MRRITECNPAAGAAPWFGKITRRLFAIFLLFALLPTLAVTGLALLYISDKATEQAENLQFAQAGMAADTMLGRLAVLAEQLDSYAERYVLQADSLAIDVEGDGLVRHFGPEVLENAVGVIDHADARQRLADGQMVLARITTGDDLAEPWLLRSLLPGDPDAYLVGAMVTQALVVGDSDSRDLRNIVCVSDELGVSLFVTDGSVCE